VPGDPVTVRASGRAVSGEFVDEATANISFAQGSEVTLFASRIADARQRTMRLTYPDGVIEIDFLARRVRNTTSWPLRQLAMDDPLGESVAAFVASVGGGPETLVRPEEARRALETALLIEESVAQDTGVHVRAPRGIALSA
jgi:predicted dehydrogenase